MAALDRLVESGKVRYLGTSNETSYGLTKSNLIAEYEGLARFESIQNNFSLLHRRFLDDLAQVCRNEKVSLLPYSPIGGGVLSGKYNGGKMPANARFTGYENAPPRQRAMARRFVNKGTLASTEKYVEIAREADLSPVTLATRWSMEFDFVASTIIGARNADIAARAARLGLGSAPAALRAGHFLGLRFPGGDLPAGLLDSLAAERVHVSVRGASMRVTPHLYNTEEDVDRLFAALERVLD